MPPRRRSRIGRPKCCTSAIIAVTLSSTTRPKSASVAVEEVLAAGVGSRVVDQQPDLEVGGRVRDGGDAAGPDQIDCQRADFDAELAAACGRRGKWAGLAGEQHQVEPRLGEQPGELGAHPLGSAGDDRPRPVLLELRHASMVTQGGPTRESSRSSVQRRRERSSMPILGIMVRIGERRSPALPSTDDQQARRAAILTAATRLGRARAIDRIHAREIAAEAGVALRTLYRYYPSKYHVYAAVLQAQVAELGGSAATGLPARTPLAQWPR